MLRSLTLILLVFCTFSNLQSQDKVAKIVKKSKAKSNVKSAQLKTNYTENKVEDETTEVGINWLSWEEAYELNQKEPRKIYVDVYTTWCGHCIRMDKTTFKDPQLVEFLNENFYAVKFDAEQKEDIVFNEHTFEYIKVPKSRTGGYHSLASALLNKRLSFPAFVVMDEQYSRIMIAPGFHGVQDVMTELMFANEEKYKTMTFQQFKMLRARDLEKENNPSNLSIKD